MRERKPGEIFDAFKVTACVDKNEGRFGGMETVGVFLTRREAGKAATGQDVMGTDAKVKVVKAITGMNGKAYECGREIKMGSDAEVRERALSKLTDEEKRALGVK